MRLEASGQNKSYDIHILNFDVSYGDKYVHLLLLLVFIHSVKVSNLMVGIAHLYVIEWTSTVLPLSQCKKNILSNFHTDLHLDWYSTYLVAITVCLSASTMTIHEQASHAMHCRAFLDFIGVVKGIFKFLVRALY